MSSIVPLKWNKTLQINNYSNKALSASLHCYFPDYFSLGGFLRSKQACTHCSSQLWWQAGIGHEPGVWRGRIRVRKCSQEQNRSSRITSCCQSLLAWNSREHLFPITLVWIKPIAQQLTVQQKNSGKIYSKWGFLSQMIIFKSKAISCFISMFITIFLIFNIEKQRTVPSH